MKFQGLMPALATPLKNDETINVKVLNDLINFFLKKGADGFYIGGATGEGFALKTEQRMILAEESIKAANGKKPCIVQIASANFSDAVTLAKHAEKSGAAAISATPPIFFRYDEDDVYLYYKTLAESVNIPMMIYYNLSAGFNMSAEFVARCFEIDNITAIKWSSSDYREMTRLKDMTHGEINIMNGPDDSLLTGLNSGADGGIGLTYNFIFDIIRDIYDGFTEKDFQKAQQAQQKACEIIDALHKFVSIPTTKVLLTEMGFDVGNAAFPSKRYSEEEKVTIIREMKKAGVVL